MQGIDVSVHNGNIDFNKVKRAGYDFVIIRIGYGGSAPVKDKNFEENYKNAKKAGLKVGVYLYSYMDSESDVIAEYKKVIEWLNGRELDLPVYLDLEDEKTSKLSNDSLNKFAKLFCEEIEKAGYWCGIYANKYWLDTKISSDNKQRFTIWVAQWSDTCTYKETYGIWQYSDKGRVAGINGNVDLNVYTGQTNLQGSINKSNINKENLNVYQGDSIVDYLKSKGVDSSFNYRKYLAKENGIKNYSGTAEQNLKLLNILRSKDISVNEYTGSSIVDYLKSIGVDSSYINRKKLATENGIKNYTGTAEQNLNLLKKLRGF